MSRILVAMQKAECHHADPDRDNRQRNGTDFIGIERQPLSPIVGEAGA